MSINVVVRVTEGVVFAADSMISLRRSGSSDTDQNYAHSVKLLQIAKPYPIGAAFCGSASVGVMPLIMLLKQFRSELSRIFYEERQPISFASSAPIERASHYTIQEVVDQLGFYLVEAFSRQKAVNSKLLPPCITIYVAGYGPDDHFAQIYQLDLGPEEVAPNDFQLAHTVCAFADSDGTHPVVLYAGITEPLDRLVQATSYGTIQKVIEQMERYGREASVSAEQIEQLRVGFIEALKAVRRSADKFFPDAAMPILDAIEYTRFLAQLSVAWSRFTPGLDPVGGPIDIATITRYEGFKWIQRKHYWNSDLNPETPDSIQNAYAMAKYRRLIDAHDSQPIQTKGRSRDPKAEA